MSHNVFLPHQNRSPLPVISLQVIMENDGSITWDDGVYSAIRRFVVYEREWICSIQIEYDQNGESIWSPRHGESDGSISEVVMDYPNEYLISIYGYYGSIHNWGIDGTVIRSLTLETNIRSYGPFGVEDGNKFSFPITGGKIVGFHGKSGRYLDGIGVHVQTIQKIGLQPEPQPKHLNMGPYGGKGGDHWEETFQTIRRLVIYHGLWIDSIQLEYEDENQTLLWSEKYGGDSGFRSEVVLELDEHLILVHGYYSDIHKWGIAATVIRSLTIKTNKRTYGPFGIEDGTNFSFPFTGLKLVGFHGRSGLYLDAIGLSVQTTQINGVRPEKFSLGEYGGEGGDPWNESFKTIKQLVINHGMWIDSIQMEYEDENGELVWSKRHGGNGGFQSEVVLELDEHLVLVHGYYSDIHKWGIAATVIRSLTLKSNKRTYGPFGIEDGTKFSFPFIGQKLVGFHGRSGLYLDAIGLSIDTTRINEVGPEKFSLGEYGGEGGDPWDESFRIVKQLVINHGQWIDSIQMEYEDQNGELVWSKRHGGNGGSQSEIALESDEHLVLVHGYYSDIRKWGIAATVIRSLTLKTNKRIYGPFGIEDGTKFSFPLTGLKVVGFHGRSGLYLDAIGLSVQTTQINGIGPEKFSFGKYGGEGGNPWNENFRTIRQLVINHGQWIDSIQMEYENENGELVWSERHGGNGGSQSKVVLDFPDEHLVTIHGYYDDIYYWGFDGTVIRSLTLETNKRSYGPFGVENGTKFSFPTVGVKIVGIHGRSGLYLDAIGLLALSIQD
nr:jacalin-related lectin 4-like [Citrullus colocynthis]